MSRNVVPGHLMRASKYLKTGANATPSEMPTMPTRNPVSIHPIYHKS